MPQIRGGEHGTLTTGMFPFDNCNNTERRQNKIKNYQFDAPLDGDVDVVAPDGLVERSRVLLTDCGTDDRRPSRQRRECHCRQQTAGTTRHGGLTSGRHARHRTRWCRPTSMSLSRRLRVAFLLVGSRDLLSSLLFTSVFISSQSASAHSSACSELWKQFANPAGSWQLLPPTTHQTCCEVG